MISAATGSEPVLEQSGGREDNAPTRRVQTWGVFMTLAMS